MLRRWLLTTSLMPGSAFAAVLASADAVGDDQQRRVREAVAEVLARPEFRRALHDGGGRTEWLREALRSAFTWVREWLWGLPTWLSWFIVAWMIFTVLAIIAHLVYVTATQLGGRRSGGERRRRAIGEIYGVRELEFDEVRAQAQRHVQAGEWSAAVRYLYVAAILWLDERGLVRFRESKTDHDYVRELAPHAGARQRFGSLTRSFEETVYGSHAPTELTCQEMAADFEVLQREAGSKHPA